MKIDVRRIKKTASRSIFIRGGEIEIHDLLCRNTRSVTLKALANLSPGLL